jgi:hypothetical protein
LSTSIFLNAVITENNVFLEEGACRIGKNKKESHGEEGNVEGNIIGREGFYNQNCAPHSPTSLCARLDLGLEIWKV